MTSLSLAALKGVHRRFDEHPWFDLAMRVPIVGYSVAVLAFDVLAFCRQVAAHADVFRDPDSGIVIATLARISQWEFILLLAVLLTSLLNRRRKRLAEKSAAAPAE